MHNKYACIAFVFVLVLIISKRPKRALKAVMEGASCPSDGNQSVPLLYPSFLDVSEITKRDAEQGLRKAVIRMRYKDGMLCLPGRIVYYFCSRKKGS